MINQLELVYFTMGTICFNFVTNIYPLKLDVNVIGLLNHSVRYCKSTTSCRNCHRRHHTLICNEKSSRHSNQGGSYNGDRSQGSRGYNGSGSRDAIGYNAGRSLDHGNARGGSLNARGVSNNVMVGNCDYGHGDANVPNGTSVLTNLQMHCFVVFVACCSVCSKIYWSVI